MKKVLMVSMLALGAGLCTMEHNTISFAVSDDTNESEMHIAAFNNDSEYVDILARDGDDVNARNSYGETPLHIAASRGHLDSVKALLRAGADVNALDRDGDTPLHMASLDEHHKIVKELLNAGAKKNIVNKDGQTAADYAALNETLDELDEQLEEGSISDGVPFGSNNVLDHYDSIGDIASGDSSPPRSRQNDVSK